MDWKIVKRTQDSGVVAHGMNRLEGAMQKAGITYERIPAWIGGFKLGVLFVGLSSDAYIYRVTDACPTEKESICLVNVGDARVAAGSDERGLAYALYELAERMEDEGERALLEMKETVDSPSQRIRGVDRFISHSGDERWWMNRQYWIDYFERMISSRFNRLTLLMGFDTGYLSPPYPFFVNVPGYENIRIQGLEFDRDAYLVSLRQIGKLCHEYGCDFTLAIWQQTPFCEGQDPLVVGFQDDDELMRFCSDGLKALLLACPEVDTLHFRVNHESGVGTQVSAEDYWLKQIDALGELRDMGRELTVELRAKGMTDRMAEHAKELGLDLLVSTKYCCEQAGLPHHLTQMRKHELDRLWNFNHSRRYSYADMLKKPRLHQFIYRCWNNGSTNLFTWGDPDYARRFVDSMRLGPSDGFEVMVPYSYKGGQETQKYDGWDLFDDPQYRPDRWEEDRYWLFYRLFGRLGYNPYEEAEAWIRPMRAHYGVAAAPMMEAISQASRFIPFLIGWHFPEHPQNVYWAEMSSGAALFPDHNYNRCFKRVGVSYQSSLACDEGMFYPIDEYLKDAAEGKEDGRYTPWQVLGWLKGIQTHTERALAAAQKIGLPENWEARGAVLDINLILAMLRYHTHKLLAAMNLSYFEQFGDVAKLPAAIEELKIAIGYWKSICEQATGKYHGRLTFGVGGYVQRDGFWTDYLPELESDLAKLCKLEDANPVDVAAPCLAHPAQIAPLAWIDDVPDEHEAGEALTVRLWTDTSSLLRNGVRLRYRHTNMLEGPFIAVAMIKMADGHWKATIPGEYLIPEWDLLVYFDAVNVDGDGLMYPGLWHTEENQPYYIVQID